MTNSLSVDLENVNSTVLALKSIDRTMALNFNRVIRGELNKVLVKARGRSPVGKTGNMRRGLKVKKGRQTKTSTGWSLVSLSREGTILEFAERGKTDRGRSLVSTLNSRYGGPGRFIWAAWDEEQSAFNTTVAAAVVQAEKDIQRELDRGGRS